MILLDCYLFKDFENKQRKKLLISFQKIQLHQRKRTHGCYAKINFSFNTFLLEVVGIIRLLGHLKSIKDNKRLDGLFSQTAVFGSDCFPFFSITVCVLVLGVHPLKLRHYAAQMTDGVYMTEI